MYSVTYQSRGRLTLDNSGRPTIPNEDDVAITEIIGMNILEKFQIGMDFGNNWIYLSQRSGNRTLVNRDYTCGDVTLITET